MTIDDWNESIRAELPEMFRQGVSSFKMYMTYPAMMVGDRDMYWALKELRHLGGICGVHCENAGVIDGMIAEKKAAGLMGPSILRRPVLPIWRPSPSAAFCGSPRRRTARWSSST